MSFITSINEESTKLSYIYWPNKIVKSHVKENVVHTKAYTKV
jgi:hypothetical protein